MSKLVLRPMSTIERPAIAAFWPTIKRDCIVLDVGANIGASSRQLAEFALMGAAMARAHFKIERPRVGLLNVGVEEIKGADEVKRAHAWLKQPELGLPFDYRGFVEGDQSARAWSTSSSSRGLPAISRSRRRKAPLGRSGFICAKR